MSDPAGRTFDAPSENSNGTGEPSVCPECSEEFSGVMAKARLGSHRWNSHQVKSAVAPRKTRRYAEPKTGRAPTKNQVANEIEAAMLFWYTMAGDFVSARDPVCGGKLKEIAPGAARSWAELSKTNEAVREFLSSSAGASGWLGIVVVHMPLIATLMGHHVTPAVERRRSAVEEARAQAEAEAALVTVS